MPFWIAKRAVPALWRRIPWKTVWLVAVWLVQNGRERVERNLTKREQHELMQLIKKSKGRPNSLARRERARVKDIAGKALRG